jgi:hypothetical protein
MYTMYIAELIDIRIAMILQMPFIFEDYIILVTKVIDVRLLITPFVEQSRDTDNIGYRRQSEK